MRKIKATIVYPVDVEIEVPEGTSVDEIWNRLVSAGDDNLGGGHEAITLPAPVIYSCSETELINRGKDREHLVPETQADFVQAATQGLLKSLEDLMPAVSALPFLGAIKTADGSPLGSKIMDVHNRLSWLLTDLISATNPVPKE